MYLNMEVPPSNLKNDIVIRKLFSGKTMIHQRDPKNGMTNIFRYEKIFLSFDRFTTLKLVKTLMENLLSTISLYAFFKCMVLCIIIFLFEILLSVNKISRAKLG